ncbi:MOSC domain-containing protein [Mycobacterium sp. 21AC1]|uniref:MOSC domain-containing protein n=1 Tax=[Mycobacterium] appelbergii TaxID=2939269 RepID=UPI0029394DB4|nr:MOSC N-terminal beta barrel domain-containing protein [Mycobacterium sp. 21AC1]MDV3127984.1 MOSC domain-containing protein [Mycobacterium sp. 21AC1]
MNLAAPEQQMHVATLRRYPVKSMLGETVEELFVDERGVQGDRRLALVDTQTGRIASAKQARLWRDLLQCNAGVHDGRVQIRLPDGTMVPADDDGTDEQLSRLLSRPVRLVDGRQQGATIERADPDQVLEQGVDAEVEAPLLELAQGTPGDSFVDFAPMHVITTATLERIGTEAERYRPNLVIATPPGYPAYAENDWVGRTLAIGQVQIRGMGPTPRCVIPTLEHGRLARAPHALRTPAKENRVQSFDFGVLPCAGAYFEVIADGTIRTGEAISLR